MEVVILSNPAPEYEVFSSPDTICVAKARFSLRLVNHRVDRPEVIIGARLRLKRKRMVFWSQTLSVIPINDERFKYLRLEPQSKPEEIAIDVAGDIPAILPKVTYLVLELEMVGPVRRMERKLTNHIERSHDHTTDYYLGPWR